MATVRSTVAFLDALSNASRAGSERHRTALLKQQVGQDEQRLGMQKQRLKHDQKIWDNTDASTFAMIELKRLKMKKALDYAEQDQKNEDAEAASRTLNSQTQAKHVALFGLKNTREGLTAQFRADRMLQDSGALKKAAQDLRDQRTEMARLNGTHPILPLMLSYAQLLEDQALEMKALEVAEAAKKAAKNAPEGPGVVETVKRWFGGGEAPKGVSQVRLTDPNLPGYTLPSNTDFGGFFEGQ